MEGDTCYTSSVAEFEALDTRRTRTVNLIRARPKENEHLRR